MGLTRDTINPFTALAVVLGVIFGYIRKRGVNREGAAAPITREFLAANTLFYGFLFVGILFFWDWFNFRNPAFTGVGLDTISLVWGFIDATFAATIGRAGLLPAEGQHVAPEGNTRIPHGRARRVTCHGRLLNRPHCVTYHLTDGPWGRCLRRRLFGEPWHNTEKETWRACCDRVRENPDEALGPPFFRWRQSAAVR